ncbi:MAG: DNA polymerase IV [Planctomycetes bacterium]|nr:DNA polymerase IV [Planctomycetota bacterium]
MSTRDEAPRIVYHVDLDAFFVAVERVLDPSLIGKPVVVGGSPEGRGVVAAASYEARAYGVHSAMPMARAVRLCPQLVRVRGSRDAYRRASKAVFQQLRALSSQLQKVSIDEAFLELTGESLSQGSAFQKAVRLQAEVRERFRLDLSIGIASNRLVAKVASGASKPVGVLEVMSGQEERFLAPLPVRKLPGIGPAIAGRLHAMRIETLGELVSADPVRLRLQLGREAEALQKLARGIDRSPVQPPDPGVLPKSISNETTFPIDRSDLRFLAAQLKKLLHNTGKRLRDCDAHARTISVKLRMADFTTCTRDRTLGHPGRDDADFFPAALDLLEKLVDGRQSVRLIGVKLSGIECGAWQPALFDG